MKFVISTEMRDNSSYHGILEPVEEWSVYVWELQTNSGDAVCASPRDFASEEEARSQIARAKTSMKGARFAKVEVEP